MRRMLTTIAVIAMATPAAAAATQDQAQNAQAQGKPVSAQARDEDQAANLMIRRIYISEPATVVLPSAVMSKLSSLGYRNLRDFDIERGRYEVEATNAEGREVEIEVDPITGVILDIDENWF